MPAPSDILQFARGQLFEKPTLPNTSFSGRTVVVTGANSGLGYEAAKHLVSLNVSTLVLACRTLDKAEAAKARLLAAFPGTTSPTTPTIHAWQVDMTSYASITALATRLRDTLPRLDALLVNAGISTDRFALAEGLESTLTVNVTGTFLLSALALPQLQRTAAQTGRPTHLTVVGSNVHAFADHAALQRAVSVSSPDANVFRALSDPRRADMAGRYFLSKLIVTLLVDQLAARTAAAGAFADVIVNCPSPGWCKTALFRTDDGGLVGRNMLKLIGRTAEVGARTLVSAMEAGRESHGEYLSEGRVKRKSVFVRSPEGKEMGERLWRDLVQVLEPVAPDVLSEL